MDSSSKISTKIINSFYFSSFAIFSLLIYFRESGEYNKFFNFLPVLGGGIPYFILTISLIFIYKFDGKKLSELGFSWLQYGKIKLKTLLLLFSWALVILFIGLVSGSIVMEAFDLIVGAISEPNPRKSPLVGNLNLLLFLTPLMWLAVIGEELLFRGFIMNFLARKFGNTTKSWILTIVMSSVIFGLAHFWQSFRGVVGAGVLSLIWGYAYYRCGRNLWLAIFAHSATNTIGFIATFNS
ncbi:MAG: membrane protease YdiL (CAAX protease family) [Paraglaciecola sp.]|jgi:membrane protease YdiL (CAAX protease family)